MLSQTRCSAIAERPRCRMGYSFRQKLKTGTAIFYGHYRSIFNHCDIIGLKICWIEWKKRKIRAITGFKVIEVGTNRKPVCDFLLMINSNWHISYRFGRIAAYCSNFGHLAFWATLWGLRDNVRCSSWVHWKARSGLPISINWTFFARCYGWVATSEKRSKIGDFAPTRSRWSKISGTKGRPPQIIFARLVRPAFTFISDDWMI